MLKRGKGENIGHVNTEIDGEKDDGFASALPWMGEPTPEVIKEKKTVAGVWNPASKRTGAVGMKVGMMSVWDARGVKQVVTVIKLDDCQVVQIHHDWTPQGEKYVNLQVGAGWRNVRRIRKATLGQFRKAGVDPKRKCAEFRVSEDAILPVGTEIHAQHFVPGQYVDVQGITRGKGFCGAMKKWGFKGQPASHGNSLTHRAVGAIGACQDPGKVWKGKKQPGKDGNRKRTHFNLQVYKIDVRRNLLFLKGSVQGVNGGMVTLVDAAKKKWNPKHPPPYPTFVPDAEAENIDELVMDVSHLPDPFKLAVP